jgi:uncharacterized protein YndB with AHSA1/START domain
MPGSGTVNSDTFVVTTPNDTEIVMTRVFDAPRQLVFEAMTKPEHVKRWWGILDGNYSLPVCEIDLRVGGAWRYVGKGPRGETAFHGVFREIAEPSRLVFTEIFELFPDIESLITSVYTEEGKKTRLTMTCTYPSKEVRDMVMSSGMEQGAAIGYDRLEEIVGELQQNVPA